MLTSTHAQILIKPYSQIKDLKQYCPDELETIKANHKSAWQVFKAFNLAVYQNLPAQFAKPHIQNWCNGWEIRRHFFAYYKYEKFLGNAPIIVVILNRQRLMVALTWHAYKAHNSRSTLQDFNEWTNEIDESAYQDFQFWHSSVNEYGNFESMSGFDYDQICLKEGEFYRLGACLDKALLDNFTEGELVDWAVDRIVRLAKVYETCHGKQYGRLSPAF